ncbi:MAG: large-conductance mechanosensitive channel [Chitinophagaceae bacterium]
MGMMKEFKEFAMKGSLIDLAVGFVMGAAFTKVTGAFINGMVMPLVGMIQGKDLSDWKLVLKDADKVAGTEEVAIKYGTFISVTIEFIIVAFVMFMVIKAINRMKKKQEEAPAAPPEPSTTDKLLMEIRDSLKK